MNPVLSLVARTIHVKNKKNQIGEREQGGASVGTC